MTTITWRVGVGVALMTATLGCQQPRPSQETLPVVTVPTDTQQVSIATFPERDSICGVRDNPIWHGAFEEKLVFHPDMTYEWSLDESNIACERGIVSFDSTGSLHLTCQKICDAGEGRSNLILGNAICSCSSNADNAEYRQTLSCISNGRISLFGNTNALTLAGDAVTLWGLPCTVVRKKGRTTRSVNLRSAPSADSSTVVIEDLATGLTREELIAGELVEILAKTSQSYVVGKWESPWYYVRVNALTGNAWVFGRYLKEE